MVDLDISLAHLSHFISISLFYPYSDTINKLKAASTDIYVYNTTNVAQRVPRTIFPNHYFVVLGA